MGHHTRRYGRKRSAGNCNEVLSDAIQEAYANLFNQPALQTAWAGKKPPSEPKTIAVFPADLLQEVIRLQNEGVSSELLIRYIDGQVLKEALSANDIVEWKKAGMGEPIIQAVMDRSPTMKRP